MQWFSWMILAAIVCSPSFSRVYPIAQATALLAGIAWDVRNETAGARPAGLTFALGGGTVQYHNARSEPVACPICSRPLRWTPDRWLSAFECDRCGQFSDFGDASFQPAQSKTSRSPLRYRH